MRQVERLEYHLKVLWRYIQMTKDESKRNELLAHYRAKHEALNKTMIQIGLK